MRTIWVVLFVLALGVWAGVDAQAGRIAEIKARYANGQAVDFSGVLKAAFADGWYIQDQDRAAGIKVVWKGPRPVLARTSTVRTDCDICYAFALRGTLGIGANREREISMSSASPLATVVVPYVNPLLLCNRLVGGCNFPCVGGGVGQCGVEPGFGPNNIGLLVRTCGTVMGFDASQQSFYIDDGTMPFDGSGRRRIKVSYADVPAPRFLPGIYTRVQVTGICSIYIDYPIPLERGIVRPVIRLRSQQDIVRPVGAWPY